MAGPLPPGFTVGVAFVFASAVTLFAIVGLKLKALVPALSRREGFFDMHAWLEEFKGTGLGVKARYLVLGFVLVFVFFLLVFFR